jgi:hypothetical protein
MDEGRWMKMKAYGSNGKGPLKGRRDRVGKVDFKAFIIAVRRRAPR